jgi:glycosyltransferase involved in cell wall biosynthesis
MQEALRFATGEPGDRPMKLRVAQVNCIIDEHDREPAELLQAWSTMALVAEAAVGAGAEVHVVQSSRTRRSYRAGGVDYRFVPEMRLGSGFGPGLMPWRLAAEIRRIRPDVVHFHGLETPVHLRAASHCGAPVLVQDHASRPSRRARWARHWSLGRVAACSFTSTEQAEPFAKEGHLPEHVRVFEIPESSSRFTPGDRQLARAQTGVFGDPALLWVGHLDANKDPLTIVRAALLALESLPELQLWCAFGKRELLPQVQAFLKQHPQLAGHVHLLGQVPHERVEMLCRACDMFVLGSHREGSGYALLEALACGLVPVVSDIPSFRSLTGDGAVGSLAAPSDVAGFVAGIIAQVRALGPGSRAAVLAHFDANLSPAAFGRRLVNAYEMLAAAANG